ncbi:OmpH family outer membrane protein [Elusimicrobiota bacterium]
MKIFIKAILLLSFISMPLSLMAIDIPLDSFSISPDGKAGSKDKNGNYVLNLGYVDASTLFDEHPMKERLKKTFLDELKKKQKGMDEEKNSISLLESSVSKERDETAKLTSDLEEFRITSQKMIDSSSNTAKIEKKIKDDIKGKEKEISEKEKSIKGIEENIKSKKEGLIALKQNNMEELEKLEKKQTALVLDDLYKVIEDLAKEENITVILDKNNILYGKKLKDFTPKVRQRLKGR